MLALVVGAKAIAGDSSIVVDAARSHETEVVPGFAHVRASLVDVLVLGGHQGCDGQEVGGGLAGAQDHIANAAHKDSVMYFTPCSFSSEERPAKWVNREMGYVEHWSLVWSWLGGHILINMLDIWQWSRGAFGGRSDHVGLP